MNKNLFLIHAILRLAFLLCLLSTMAFEGKSQSVIGTTSGEGTVGNLLISYTVGESFVATIENDGMISSQGFHQPTYIITAIKETLTLGSVMVFPNPTSSILNVNLEGVELENIMISLHDMTGRNILTSKVTTSTWQTDLTQVPNGYYILIITDRTNNKSNSFKIFKSN